MPPTSRRSIAQDDQALLAGKGRATHEHEVLGKIVVTITVTAKGTSTGKLVFGGLCDTTATFSARRRT